MIMHKNGTRPRGFVDKIPYHLQAALEIDGKPLSIHAIVQMTGYNHSTVKRHLERLCKAGIVETIPTGAVNYSLVKTQPEGEAIT